MTGTLLMLLGLFLLATIWRRLAGRRRRRMMRRNLASVYQQLADDDRRRIAELQERAARDAVRPNGHVDHIGRH